MNEEQAVLFQKLCETIKAGIPEGLEWEWDDRFSAALVPLDAASKAVVYPLLEKTMPFQWDKKTISKASKPLKNFVNDNLDLKTGQFLFSSDGGASEVLVAAWWPWGNGINVSLRVGLYDLTKDEAQQEILSKKIREWFTD